MPVAPPRAGERTPLRHRPGSALVIALLADKWTIPVIHALARRPARTGALRRELAGVSQKMLTQTLRALEGHGLVARIVRDTVPPEVEYRLTPLGASLNAPLAELCAWAERHGDELASHGVRKDGRA